ncbi:MAG: phosphoribosyltransferase [Actinomycetota bacterium]|nr:phosphoribosyltransferase [Actinomycetota bacterium]
MINGRRFDGRRQAGQLLAAKLLDYRGTSNLLVLGLPRGGVPVAFEVAKALDAPLDVFVVRKLGIPAYPELAMGAVATGGVRVLNPRVISELRVSEDVIERVAAKETEELERREREYRGSRPPPRVRGATVIIVDDGLATGATMRAAVQSLRLQDPAKVIVAVPTGASRTCKALRDEADEVICLIEAEHFYSVGQWYKDFEQLTDDEVSALLEEASMIAKQHPGQT